LGNKYRDLPIDILNVYFVSHQNRSARFGGANFLQQQQNKQIYSHLTGHKMQVYVVSLAGKYCFVKL